MSLFSSRQDRAHKLLQPGKPCGHTAQHTHHAMAPLFFCAFKVSYLLTALATTIQSKKYQVCLSPGCVADGAQETLQKLQALAPPGMSVSAGTCESLCGNGPVVVEESDKKIVHRRISGDALLDLIIEADGDYPPPSRDLLDGYELVMQAGRAKQQKDYDTACLLYKRGIQHARQSAIDLQRARDEMSGDMSPEETTVPTGLKWLVRAYRGHAESLLAVGDVDGAFESSTEACTLSCQKDSSSLELLAKVCQVKNDPVGELDALRLYFALPFEGTTNLSQAAANRRRQIGFRLAKLEREVDT